jgi:hypothetical protein
MHHTDPVIGAFADDMRFLEQQALRDGFTAAQWRHYWGWNSIALAQVRAAAQQTAPIYPMWAFAPYAPMSAFVDALNAVIDAQHPEWDETSAHAAWQLQCQELMALANQIPPDVRADTTRFPWLNDASVNDVIRMQTNHSTEHYEKSVAEQAYDTVLAAFRTMYKRWTAYAATPDADAALFTHLWAWQTISLPDLADYRSRYARRHRRYQRLDRSYPRYALSRRSYCPLGCRLSRDVAALC